MALRSVPVALHTYPRKTGGDLKTETFPAWKVAQTLILLLALVLLQILTFSQRVQIVVFSLLLGV